ncbi:U6 snRNA phosphodiesterase [Schistosoma japonicum]|nr:U6 snRNA phosphodiesterase [Schistosoma japonicum]
MSLVEYSSSDEEKSEKLELPPGLQGLSSDCFRFSVREEDPSRHNYRSRTFPHEPGSWATSIYIACPHFYSRIQEAIKSPIIQLNPIINDCCAVDFLHISLSKTWPIYFHWIENLACNLRSAPSNSRFCIAFDNVEVLVNEENTRSFFTLITSEESRVALTPLLSSVDSCVTAFRGPAYYKNPKFHMSFLWFNGDVHKKYSKEIIDDFMGELRIALFAETKQLYHEVTDIVCKSGNKYFDISLL